MRRLGPGSSLFLFLSPAGLTGCRPALKSGWTGIASTDRSGIRHRAGMSPVFPANTLFSSFPARSH